MLRTSKHEPVPGVKVHVIDPREYQQTQEASIKPESHLGFTSSVTKTIVIGAGRAEKLNNNASSNSTWHHRRISSSSSKVKSNEYLPTRGIIAKENREIEEDDGDLMKLLSKRCKTRSGRETKPIATTIRGLCGDFATTSQLGSPRRKGREPPEFFRCQTCQKFYVGNRKLKEHLQKFPTHQPSLEYQKANAPKRKVGHASVAVQSEVVIGNSTDTLEEPDSSPPSPAESSRHTETATEFLVPPAVPLLPQPSEIRFVSATTSAIGHSPSPTISLDVQSTPVLFREVVGNELNPASNSIPPPSPSPSSNSLPFWNSFTSFTNSTSGRGEASPEDRPESAPLAGVGPPHSTSTSRKEEPVDASSGLKTIWDVVERKLSQSGINHILSELSDVAEKLGKIARDKIIPIREDEEERVPTSTPIVRVENPFMSHLLDLPFGAYVFREDGGMRRPLPPPCTDLSLTAGEVDIDKFLACNMEMDLSLPHLTSLDIAAVCNN